MTVTGAKVRILLFSRQFILAYPFNWSELFGPHSMRVSSNLVFRRKDGVAQAGCPKANDMKERRRTHTASQLQRQNDAPTLRKERYVAQSV